MKYSAAITVAVCALILGYQPVLCEQIRVPADYPTIQAGIDAAVDGDTVLVAAGNYSGEGNRDIEFWGKKITVRSTNGPEETIIDCEGSEEYPRRGFYFHSGETEESVLDGFTIENGDLNGLENCYEAVGGGIRCSNHSSPTIENCIVRYCKAWLGCGMFCEEESSPAISNCTLQNNDCEVGHGAGGGLYIQNSSPVITNCIISGNICYQNGAGITCHDASPIIDSCLIERNETWAHGGGIYCQSTDTDRDPIIINCTISENIGEIVGGGIMASYSSNPTILSCRITGNSASGRHAGMGFGGGIACYGYSSAYIADCNISNNIAKVSGGGLDCAYAYNVTVKNCIIADNTAPSGGGMFYSSEVNATITNCTIIGNTATDGIKGGGIGCYDNSSPVIQNCIVWGNSPNGIWRADDCHPEVTYSDVQGGWPGEGNIGTDPLFVTKPMGGRFYLSHTDSGQAVNSPCHNAGSDPAADICFDLDSGTICMDSLTTRIDDVVDMTIVDMGYHYTTNLPPVSPTPAAETPTPTHTATPVNTSVRVVLEMPATRFSPGDTCWLIAWLYNEGDPMDQVPLFVILDIYGQYWFWDDWTHVTDYTTEAIPTGETMKWILTIFKWPDTGSQSMSNLVFWGALTNPEMTEILGQHGMWPFEYGP